MYRGACLCLPSPFGAGFRKPARHSRALEKTPGRARRLGVCLAALGATRAPSQCPPVLIPGLAFSIGPRLGVAASRLTSRYCGATFAAERAGVQATCRLASLNPGPAALASFLGYHKLPLSSVCPTHSAARSSHLLRGETWAIARPRADPAMSPPPTPACCCGGVAPQQLNTLMLRWGPSAGTARGVWPCPALSIDLGRVLLAPFLCFLSLHFLGVADRR